MMQKIQKFGGAMFTPVLLFAFAGVVIGLGTLFTTEVIFGSLAAPDTLWYGVWNVILQGGWTVFNQLPLLFAVSLPIGLANKQNARCCMEVLVAYLTFNYFVSTMLSQWGRPSASTSPLRSAVPRVSPWSRASRRSTWA